MNEYWTTVLDLLKRFEGFKDSVYYDGKGIPTIGYGFTDPKLIKKGKISKAEADRRLILEARNREEWLKKNVKNWGKLSDASKAALISYYYNFPKGFAPDSDFTKYWNAGEYGKAIHEVDAGMYDKDNPGLFDRRLEEQRLLKTGPFLYPQPLITVSTKGDGKKVMKFSMPDYTKGEKRIPEVPLEVLQNNTVYPPAVATPEYLNPYNNADSPAYGGTTPRIRGIQELTDEERRKYDNLLPEVNAYGKQPSPFALPTLIDMMNDGKEKWVRNITGMPSIYDEQSGPTINLFKIPTLYANKGKDLYRYDDGKDVQYADSTWHENWLNGRKKQFDANNALVGGSDSISGLILNINNTTESYDDLGNAVSGKHYDYDNTIIYNTNPINKRIRNRVGDSDDDIKIHERTHAMKPRAQEAAIKDILIKNDLLYLGYAYDPKEVYAHLMQNRYKLNLSPEYQVTLEDVAKWRASGLLLGVFNDVPDEVMVKYFNEIAWDNNLPKDINRPLYANKGKDLPKYAPGKDEELVERGGITYNVDPSAVEALKSIPDDLIKLNVTVPNTTVRSNPGALQARDIRNENARIMAARFLAQHPFGPNTAPIEPGLELTYPEFDILSLIGGLANISGELANTSSKAVRQAAKPYGSPNAYKDIAKDPYINELFGKYFSRQRLAYRALQSKKPTNDIFEGLPDYIKGNRFYGTDYDELPEDIYNIVKQSSYDRLRAKRPWLTDEEFDKQFAQAIKGGFSEYPEETFIAAGRSKNGGLLFPSNGHIAIREGYVNNALPHEVRHRMQQAFPHTQAEEELIEPAFGLWWYDLPKKYPELSSVTDDIGAEIDTSILDFRRALIGDTNLSRMAKEQLNNFMANTSLSLRRRAAQSANGYLRKAYEDKLSISQEAADEWVNLLVEVAKQLGAYSAPVVSGAALYNLMQQSDILPKHKKGKDLPRYGMGEDIVNAAADFGKGVTPIYGTYLDAKEFYNNPSPETLGYLALSALSDGLLLSGAGSFLGMGLKSLRGARAASRAAKALSVTPGKHLARYSAKTAEAARLKKKAAQQLTKGASIDIMPQTIQTYKKYAE